MRFSLRPPTLAWTIVLAGTVGFLLWLNAARIDRVNSVTALGGATVTVDRSSPTGYADGVRLLITPERNAESYQWLAQTQQMFAQGEWRVRHVDYDNAPAGREIRTPSVYRWWLGLVAWFDHSLSIRPLGISVEHAAVLADPALHVLLLIGATLFVVGQFGAWPAAFLALGLVFLHPFAGAFLPGQPNDQGWVQTAALWSVLLLLTGLRNDLSSASETQLRTRRERWFFAGGVVGAIGMWVSVHDQLPILMGIATGGLLAAVLAQREAAVSALSKIPWRHWALGGAFTTLLAYFAEYFPAHMASLSLDTIHPMHGIAWLGAGELLARVDGWIRRTRPGWTRRSVVVLVLAVVAVIALPVVAALSGSRGLFSAAPLATRLSNVPNAPVAGDLFAWISQAGASATLLATVIPLAFAVFAGWLLARRKTAAADRQTLALALGPVSVGLGFAVVQLRWWALLDSVLLALLVATVAAISRAALPPLLRWTGGAVVAVGFLLGALLIVPPRKLADGYAVTAAEVEALIERDLAHWLAKRAGPRAVVLAPPQLTVSLFFHGGLRGLGTPYQENPDGFAAAVRIASTTAIDETLALVERRGLTHIVVPSWDRFLDDYARLGSGQLENSFIDLLHRWMPPRWLRAVAYQMPAIQGFEGQSVAVFEVVELQENAVALSRLAEYFLETGRLELALSASHTLGQHFSTDLGATIARAQIEASLPNGGEFSSVLATVESQLAAGADRHLPWDRRVALALVLARGKRFEPARAQLERCVAELDEPRLRSLTTAPLYRLQVLLKAFSLEISDPRLRGLARELLPEELRNLR